MGEVEEEMSPRSARAKLADEIKVLQRKVSSLLVLRAGAPRREQLDELRQELAGRQA